MAAAAASPSGWDVFASSSDEDEDEDALSLVPAAAQASAAAAAAASGAASASGAGTACGAAPVAAAAATTVLGLLEREGHHHLAQDLLLSPSAALSLQDLLAVRRASRFWRDAASDHSLWRQRLVALWHSRSYVPGAWRALADEGESCKAYIGSVRTHNQSPPQLDWQCCF